MIKYFWLIFFIVVNLWADEEFSYSEIAKYRKYPSGADESDLKVQPTLKKLPTKKKKQTTVEPIDGF